MSRLTRKAVILAKIESTYGTDPTPTGAANAIQVSNLSINQLNAQNVPRDLVKGWIGADAHLVGTKYKECSFDVELQSSGTAGTAPAWGPLARACGLAETVSAGNRVEYTPISAAFESLTIYYHMDGLLHKLTGVRGTFELSAIVGERPMLRFQFIGLDGGDTAVADATPTLTAWRVPQVVTDTNTTDINFGCTYSTGSLSGGTEFTSRGLSMTLGASVTFTPLVGSEEVHITNRETTGHVDLDLTAAQHATLMTDIKAVTTSTLGLVHGTAAGSTIVVHAPVVQRLNPSYVDVDGLALVGVDLRFVPSTGNDEFRIVAK